MVLRGTCIVEVNITEFYLNINELAMRTHSMYEEIKTPGLCNVIIKIEEV